MSDVVFTVHANRPDDTGGVEIIYDTEGEARAFAESRSRDQRVLSASVTRFDLGRFGSRLPIAFYVDGSERAQRFNRPQLYPSAAAGERPVR